MSFSSNSVPDRRSFIGGSDARVIMGDDEANLIRLWRESLEGGARRERHHPCRRLRDPGGAHPTRLK